MKGLRKYVEICFILFFVEFSVQAQAINHSQIISIQEDTLNIKEKASFANVSTGMFLSDIKNIYPKAVFTEVATEKYGDNCHNYGTGYEISLDSQLLMFVVFKKSVCILLYGISRQYNVGNLNTGMTIEQVMNLYPSAQLKIDILNEMEYISIPELSITLYFTTNENNRIGVYTDPEDPATKIIRADTKISFIVID